MFVEGCVINTNAFYIYVFLGTNTGLETQVDVLISLMNLVSSKWWSSVVVALRFGSSKHQRGCLTSRAFGSTLSACMASSLGTPSMSMGHQAKISPRSQRN
jgi:hypothetical protein